MELNIDLVRDLFLHLDDNDSSIERINCDDDLLFYQSQSHGGCWFSQAPTLKKSLSTFYTVANWVLSALNMSLWQCQPEGRDPPL